MKFICDKTELLKMINTVQKAVPAKSTLPILEGIKIDATANGSIIFTGNNLELCIEYQSECNIPEGGSIVLASRMFGEIVRRLPDGELTVEVNEENNVTKLSSGRSEFNILALDAGEFPSAPELSSEFSFSMSQVVLKRMIRQTIFAVASDEMRPVLTGSLFEINDDNISVVSIDGYRLALRKEHIESSGQTCKFVIPGSTLRELLKLLKDEDEPVVISVSERHILFDFGEFKVTTRLLDGEFVNYAPIISASNTTVVIADTKAMCESMERTALLVNEDSSKSPVRLTIGTQQVEINCMTSMGRIHDIIPVDVHGEGLEIGFNYRYLLDALRACEEEEVRMEFSTPLSACFIKPVNGEEYIYMVQPVRLYGN